MRSGSGGSLSELPEPSGADSSQVICRSLNKAAVRHNLLRVGLPIAAAPVQVPTVRQNAPVILTKRRHTIANADRLLPPCPRPLPKPGVNGCTLFVFLIVFLPCFLSALIAFSFFSMFPDLESLNYFLSCVT